MPNVIWDAATLLLKQRRKFDLSSDYEIMYICKCFHYSDVIISAMASKITGISIVYSTVCSGADQRQHQSSASLAFVGGIRRSLVNSPHKGPVTRKMLRFDDVIMFFHNNSRLLRRCRQVSPHILTCRDHPLMS